MKIMKKMEKMKMKENLYRTGDLWLTSFLIANGAKLIKFEDDNINPDKIVFCLKNDEDLLKEIAKTYFLGASVPAINYKDITLDLKHQIYRHLRSKNEGKKINGKPIRSMGQE